MQYTRNWLYEAFAIGIFMVMSGSLYVLYRELGNLRESIEQVSEVAHRPKISDQPQRAKIDTTPAKKQQWSAIQTELQNAILQVFTERTEFNWVEPYKTPKQVAGSGSAFFINDEGDIITNAHVVDQAIAVSVQIPTIGKKRFSVDVQGVSPERDLALLKMRKDDQETLKKMLDLKKLPYLKMADSDAVKRGDKIMALGFPLGQQGLKSTTGVVSGREHLPMAGYFIQISAPINPGNSGGPSVDNSGRTVGVNSVGVPGAQNVGYIIPSNEVLLFLDQLETVETESKTKLLRRPFLGVFFNTANDNLRAYLKNPPPGGLYVVDVYKGGPFDRAGINAGDMIYSIDGYPIDMHGEMSVPWSKEDRISIIDYIARLKLDHTVKLIYYRKGEKKTAAFKLSRINPPIRQMYPGLEKIDYEVLAGFVFMPITANHVILLSKYAPQLMKYADPKEQIEPSLLITHVMLNSPASALKSLGAGGIIAEVNGKKVKTLDDFRNAVLESTKTGYLTLKTTDNQFAAIPLEDIVQNEERLSHTYFFSVSDLFKELKRLAQQK